MTEKCPKHGADKSPAHGMVRSHGNSRRPKVWEAAKVQRVKCRLRINKNSILLIEETIDRATLRAAGGVEKLVKLFNWLAKAHRRIAADQFLPYWSTTIDLFIAPSEIAFFFEFVADPLAAGEYCREISRFRGG